MATMKKQMPVEEFPKDVESRVIKHMNADHRPTLLAIAWRLCNVSAAVNCEMLTVDPAGFDVKIVTKSNQQIQKRIDFDRKLSQEALRPEFVKLHHKVMKPAIPSGPSPPLALLGLWVVLPLIAFPALANHTGSLAKTLDFLRVMTVAQIGSVERLQYIFYLAIGAHVIEAVVAGYLLRTKLKVELQDTIKWCALVFLFGYPVSGKLFALAFVKSVKQD